MLLIRIVLAEQNTADAWLQYVGLQNEQMTNLAWSISPAFCAIIASCLTLLTRRSSTGRPPPPCPDHGWPCCSTVSPTPLLPEQLMFSQFCLASAAPGAGDARRYWRGIRRSAQPGQLSVLFGMSQNIGGLLTTAILGTFQTWREKFHPVSWRIRSPPQPADRRASAAVQPDVPEPDRRQHAA